MWEFILATCALFFILQAGCATYVGVVVGASSIKAIAPYPITMDKIPWDDPKALSLNGCSSIDGVYELVPEGKQFANYQITQLFDTPQPSDRLTTVEEFFNQPDPIPSDLEARKIVERNQLVALHISGNKAIKLELNKNGKIFNKKMVRLEPDLNREEQNQGWECRVGCFNGEYIYRRVASYNGGAEGGGKDRYWFELRIRKLANGNLEIHQKNSHIGITNKVEVVESLPLTYRAYHGPLPELSYYLTPQ